MLNYYDLSVAMSFLHTQFNYRVKSLKARSLLLNTKTQ